MHSIWVWAGMRLYHQHSVLDKCSISTEVHSLQDDSRQVGLSARTVDPCATTAMSEPGCTRGWRRSTGSVKMFDRCEMKDKSIHGLGCTTRRTKLIVDLRLSLAMHRWRRPRIQQSEVCQRRGTRCHSAASLVPVIWEDQCLLCRATCITVGRASWIENASVNERTACMGLLAGLVDHVSTNRTACLLLCLANFDTLVAASDYPQPMSASAQHTGMADTPPLESGASIQALPQLPLLLSHREADPQAAHSLRLFHQPPTVQRMSKDVSDTLNHPGPPPLRPVQV